MTGYGTVYWSWAAILWITLGGWLGRGLSWHASLVVVALAPGVALLHGMLATMDDTEGRLPNRRGR